MKKAKQWDVELRIRYFSRKGRFCRGNSEGGKTGHREQFCLCARLVRLRPYIPRRFGIF